MDVGVSVSDSNEESGRILIAALSPKCDPLLIMCLWPWRLSLACPACRSLCTRSVSSTARPCCPFGCLSNINILYAAHHPRQAISLSLHLLRWMLLLLLLLWLPMLLLLLCLILLLRLLLRLLARGARLLSNILPCSA